MGVFVPKPRLADDERVLTRPGANRSQGNRAVGGRLFLTDQRFIFSPNVIDRVTGGRSVDWPRESVIGVDVSGRSAHPFSGFLRRRLRLRLADGSAELFVVNHVDRLAEYLRNELGIDE